MTAFYSKLNYSFGNEDWSTDHRALRIQPTDRVVCITASGDRPLHNLLDNCKEVIAVDANSQQNYLLALKMAAMQQLDFADYLSFLEGDKKIDQMDCLQYLKQHMPSEASLFWHKQRQSIQAGVLFQGSLERLTQNFAILLKVLMPYKVPELFAIRDLQEQQEFIQRRWQSPLLKNMFNILLHPFTILTFLRDPGLYAQVPRSFPVGDYIYKRMNNYLLRHLANESILLSLIFRGTVDPEMYPPYLTKSGYDSIRMRLNRLSYQTADIVDYLESSPDNHFDAFSLSDVASYISPEKFKRLMHAVCRTATPGARFSIRQFLSFHSMPTELREKFQRDSKLEQELENEDRCFVYRVMAGSIAK